MNEQTPKRRPPRSKNPDLFPDEVRGLVARLASPEVEVKLREVPVTSVEKAHALRWQLYRYLKCVDEAQDPRFAQDKADVSVFRRTYVFSVDATRGLFVLRPRGDTPTYAIAAQVLDAIAKEGSGPEAPAGEPEPEDPITRAIRIYKERESRDSGNLAAESGDER